MSKKPATPATIADSTSDEIVVAFTPSDRSARNASVPQRHLTAADLARLAYVEAVRQSAGLLEAVSRPDPRTPDPGIVGEIVARLEATGRFTTDAHAVASAAAETSPALPAESTPAESAADTTEG